MRRAPGLAACTGPSFGKARYHSANDGCNKAVKAACLTRMTAPPPVSTAPALLVDDPSFDAHAPLGHHPERPERLRAARAAVQSVHATFIAAPTREATADELARVHAPAFVESLERWRGKEGYLDPDTYVAAASVVAARKAAGGSIDMVDKLLAGPVRKGVALLRPPGHHATPDRAMGFCLLNNVALVAAHARARGVERVAIVDWDVHHGNGTQDAFWDDPSVLYVSLHQWPFYPGSGAASERGEGEGEGFTVNVPLSAHADDGTYRSAFERVVVPVLDAYAPELVLVSAGFDAAQRDPLAQMDLGEDAFGWMAAALRDVAERHAQGRMALLLEGGYDLVALEAGLRAATTAMLAPGGSPPPAVSPRPDHPDLARAVRNAQKTWKHAG
jgi:acetoin utilization deacetylase AcuC-like enzyme